MDNIKNFSELSAQVEHILNDTAMYLAVVNLIKWADKNASEAEKIEFLNYFSDYDFENVESWLGMSDSSDWFEKAPSWDELENMEF